MNCSNANSLNLDKVREALIRQEDTIIFNLIERAQYLRNHLVYYDTGIDIEGHNKTYH